MKTIAFILTGALAATCAQAIAEPDKPFIYTPPEDVAFKSPFGVGPDQAVLYGDPSKPGLYVVRVRFPPGAHSNPHFHSKDRHAVVLKGVWWNGVGETLDFGKAKPLKAGSYVLHPAGGVHWDGAGDEETIVQIIGEGPVETTRLDTPGVAAGYWPKPK
ncbi:cupin domain-containing protein [Methylosinus sp. Sm6]|uniref:cupin domain-containing protein n=1 Tax=Methylosinus sp. Sm6 TaxID=2866948 RepID=UPI001C993CC7|nr:cupin domain-containing protein [Methylosinus sp. Sm6]MBY6241366.1 cupin domain-containing protein [Methylosinus sp. Sm6]